MKRIALGIIAALSVVLLFFYAQLNRGMRPLRNAGSETVELAQRKADLKKADKFYWYNGKETYFTVTGKDKNQKNIVVIVKQKGGDVQILNQAETISEKKAIQQTVKEVKPKQILNAKIGVVEETPIWEVSFLNKKGQLGYYMMELEDGSWLRTLENI